MSSLLFDMMISGFFFMLTLSLKPMGAFPRPGLNVGGRMLLHVSCGANQGYLHDNICCLNCPAGTRVKSPCTRAGQEGTCEKCDHGTYTEHDNGLNQCFKCTKCRSDQEIARQCTSTQNTECQCKPGRFCAPEQACEVCKKCLRCGKDEQVVRNCTSTTDTECKKIQASSSSASGIIAVIVLVVIVAAVIIGAVFYWRMRRCRAAGSQSSQPDGMKAGHHHTDSCSTQERRNGENRRHSSSNWQLVRPKSSAGMEDEREVLCKSLNSSASNSQHSLTGLPSSAFPATLAQASPVVPRQPDRREYEQLPKLIPVSGEESLRKCFEYFEEMDVSYYKRFFRHLGLTDNMIKSKEHLQYEDRIHELLNIWVEKVGRDASLNDLLKALFDLNQRRTAEMARESAVRNGHYIPES
uniref:Uncharacterized protein n=1 Tax=Monopterus albus TaxID=43700 RepID=A0A3Q3IN69_MONAL